MTTKLQTKPLLLEDLKRFEEKEPELILRWKDDQTEAKGWLVINSLRGGAAGGGTRMKKGIDLQEVSLLAKTMEIKFTVSGPRIGGAKSGIDFDPLDPRKRDVLRRWFKAVSPMLKTCHGTGGDLNVDFINEITPLTRALGILHPQEGILEGHFSGNQKAQKAARLSEFTSKIVQDPKFSPDQNSNFTITDLISGYSVAESVVHYYRIFNESIKDKRVIIQGWGKVGASAGYYLSQAGAKIIGIADIYGGIINKTGFEPDEVRGYLVNRKLKDSSAHPHLPFDDMMRRFWHLPADIFVPAAASKLITKAQAQSIIDSGVSLIACGANVPFADDANFFGDIAEYTDNQISVIPDFVANCGVARVFAYLMEEDGPVSEESIFTDVSTTVETALKKVCNSGGSSTRIAHSLYQQALEQLI